MSSDVAYVGKEDTTVEPATSQGLVNLPKKRTQGTSIAAYAVKVATIAGHVPTELGKK